MLQYVLYVAAPGQVAATRSALARIGAKKLGASDGPTEDSYSIEHPLIQPMKLHVHLATSPDAVTPHLKQNPIDLLIYDERGEGGIEARRALSGIRDDCAAFASMWGPDFVFPMSRTVAILGAQKGSARAFELGRVQVRDVCVNPKSTAEILRWLREVLLHGISRQSRVGWAMSGGGIEGFLYQLGVLYALEQATGGLSVHDAEVYSGVSSGAVASALLAAKVPLAEVILSLTNRSETLRPMTSGTIFDIAGVDIVKRIVMNSVGSMDLVNLANPQKWIGRALRNVPTGFFKGEALESYFSETLTRAGRGDSFDKLGRKLFIGATDQDSFEHVVFGRAPDDQVSISKALRASTALPPLFVPCPIGDRFYIDGQVTRTTNLELVIDSGARLIFIIDPLRPYVTNTPGSLEEQGGVYALIQVIKALVHTRFQVVLNHVAERYPDVDFIVFQPDEACAKIMSGSPMRYKIRTQLIRLAFRGTVKRLQERHHVYQAKLNRYGITLKSPEELARLEAEHAHVLTPPD